MGLEEVGHDRAADHPGALTKLERRTLRQQAPIVGMMRVHPSEGFRARSDFIDVEEVEGGVVIGVGGPPVEVTGQR